MNENYPFEAEVVHNLPKQIAAGIGNVIVGTSKLEHKLTSMIGLILQMDKAEMRLTLRQPRIEERLDIILELFALKALNLDFDFTAFRKTLIEIGGKRHRLAHGIWLQHPETDQLYLRLARGSWPKSLLEPQSDGKLRRDTFPQSIPYGAEELDADNALINAALATMDQLGDLLDLALATYPERFRKPLPPVNPLGSHKPKGREDPP
jgi:hypothetical protein